MTTNRLHLHILLLAALALALTSCPSFQYRKVQSTFEEAVLADNAQLNPVIDRSAELYGHVAQELTEERIGELDTKLRPNAWLLRAFSQWRSGSLEDARVSAQKGRAAQPVANSRDDVLLHLIPVLVVDSQVMEAWRTRGEQTDPGQYEALEKDFKTALDQIKKSLGRFGPATPHSTRYYVQYQRWRIMQNWRGVIAALPERVDRQNARAAAAATLGKPLKDAAKEARDAIPVSHFLNQQIVSQGG